MLLEMLRVGLSKNIVLFGNCLYWEDTQQLDKVTTVFLTNTLKNSLQQRTKQQSVNMSARVANWRPGVVLLYVLIYGLFQEQQFIKKDILVVLFITSVIILLTAMAACVVWKFWGQKHYVEKHFILLPNKCLSCLKFQSLFGRQLRLSFVYGLHYIAT